VIKGQGGPPTNSGPVAIDSGMPVVVIDSPVVREVFGPPEDDDITVVNRGSKRGRTGLEVSTVWEYLTNDIKPNTLPFVSCQHCMSAVIELSRRDSPKWHMRLAFDHVNCLPKTLFLVPFCALYFLHPRWVFARFVVCVYCTNLVFFHPSSS
jgi:hypothetical protein